MYVDQCHVKCAVLLLWVLVCVATNTDHQNTTHSPCVDPPDDSSHQGLSRYRFAYQRLRHELTSRTVVKNQIPPCGPDDNEINVYFTPFQVLEVNDNEQSVRFKMTFALEWMDPNLVWNSEEYCNITSMKIPSWTPFMMIPQAIENQNLDIGEYLIASANGAVGLSDTFIVTFLCNLDLKLFPFDRHSCSFDVIFEGGYNPVYSNQTIGGEDSFATAGEWNITDYRCKSLTASRGSNKLRCCITIDRKDTFYVANIVIPMILTSLVTLTVFVIPAQSGEKTSFLLNVYISTSVFLNFIVDYVPRSMSTVSNVPKYISSKIPLNFGG